MTSRTRIFAALAALILLVSILAAGCTNLQGFTRTADGKLSYPQGDNTWTWEKKGATVLIGLNGKSFATLDHDVARVVLPDSRSFDVVMTKNGDPSMVRLPWGTTLTQTDYDTLTMAFKVNTLAGGIPTDTPWGWILILVLILVAGVLLTLFAGRVVDSAKVGGIFSGTDTAKSLLIFRAAGIIVALLALVILIAVAS